MTGTWSPNTASASTVGGWLVEVPARAPELPINLWLHWSGLSVNVNAFPQSAQTGDWHRDALITFTTLALGDVALAGQATVGLANVRREEQGLGDTDDWGVSSADWLNPLQAPVVGPNAVTFAGQMAARGRSAAIGVSLTIDLLVLRPSLIPEMPPVHGTRQAHGKITAPWSTEATLDGPGHGRSAALRAQLQAVQAELDSQDAAEEASNRRPGPTTRHTTVQLSLGPPVSRGGTSERTFS